MAYTLPAFNLVVNIWRNPPFVGPADYTLPQVITSCNLSMGRRVTGQPFGQINAVVLFPPLTDIRPSNPGFLGDVVEIPAGSQRWYTTGYVDDFGKGFPNEHRFAVCTIAPAGITFVVQGLLPFPFPMP